MDAALELNPEFSEADYMKASFAAILKKPDMACLHLERAVDADYRYFYRSQSDPVFQIIPEAHKAALAKILQKEKKRSEQAVDALAHATGSVISLGVQGMSDSAGYYRAKLAANDYATVLEAGAESSRLVHETSAQAASFLDQKINQRTHEFERASIVFSQSKEIQGFNDTAGGLQFFGLLLGAAFTIGGVYGIRDGSWQTVGLLAGPALLYFTVRPLIAARRVNAQAVEARSKSQSNN